MSAPDPGIGYVIAYSLVSGAAMAFACIIAFTRVRSRHHAMVLMALFAAAIVATLVMGLRFNG